MADFQFFLNRQGPRGPQGYKGDKGDDGKTPVPRTGTNTPIETTVIFDTGDGNPYETPNLKYPIEDRGGNVVMLDRANETQYYGTPDQATDNSYGIVKLATPESVLDDPLDNDVVTYELFDDNNQAIKTVTDGLAGDITQLDTDLDAEVTNRTNADTQLTNKINTDVDNEATARTNADNALSGRIDNLANVKANKSDVYTKTQTDSLLNNKSNVGHTHNYNEITNKPDIGNGTITITQGGVVKGSFTTNQLSNGTIALDAGGGGVNFETGTGLELTQQNVLNVKIDGTTITTNASGELVANNSGGTTYTPGNGIDLTNDEIAVKYDNDTLKLNGTGQLYADIPTVNDATITVTQGGVTKGTFTTNQGTNGTIALDAGPDMSSYYTKSQTDSLLDGKISNDIVQYPLQYLTDTTDNLTYQNVNTITMIGSGRGIDFYYHTYISSGYAYVGTESGEVRLSSSNVDIVNNSSLTWFETELTNGFNFAFRQKLSTTENATVAVGHYEDGNFVPDAICGSKGGYTRGLAIYIVNTNRYYNFYEISTTPDIVQFYLTATQLNAADVGGSNYKSYTTVTQAEANALNAVTHIRVYPDVTSNSTITLSNIKVVNPTSVTPVTDGDATSRQAMFDSGINIFDAHPESLSLKYDSNTLGINASNELYALSSTPSNMVTIDTAQNITGVKTFNTDCLKTKNILFNESGYSYGLRISSGTLRYGQTSGDYSYMETSSIGVEASSYKHQLAANGLWSGTGTNNAYTQRIGLSGSGYSYLANNQGRKFYNPTYSSATSSFTPDANTPFFMTSDLLDGTTITYDSSTGKISAAGGGGSAPIATSSTPGIVQPDNSTITINGNGIISAVNNSIAKTAPVIPLKYEEQEDGVSTGVGGVLNHTTYTDSADKVYVADASTTGIYNMSGDGYIYQSAANMMSKIFYRGYKIRLDNGLNIAWNIAEGSGFFMNVAVGYYNNGAFVPVLYALNTNSYGGSMFARPALEIASDVYDMGRLNTQFTSCVGISLLGNVLSAFSPSNGRHTYTISDTTLLTELQKCTHAICTVINESSTGTTFNYSTGKFANPATTLSDDSEARNTIFSAAENLILNDDVTVIPELKLNYDSNALGVNASNELTVPTATTSNLGLVKPDGSTITINNGVISAAGGSAPSNMVTTDTTQNITGVKSFTNNYSAALIAQAEYGIMVSTNMSDYNSGYGVNLNKYGVDIRGQNNLGQITISSNSTLGQTSYLFTIKQASNKTKFIHDDYLSDKKIYRDNNATNFLLEKDMLDGTYLKWDSANNKITVDIQAIKDAIDALSNSSGTASQGSDLNPGGWL